MGIDDIIEENIDKEDSKPSFLSSSTDEEEKEETEDWNKEPVAWEEVGTSIDPEEISISGAGWYIILDGLDENNLTYLLDSLGKKDLACLIELYDNELHSDRPFGVISSDEIEEEIRGKKRLLITAYENEEEE